MELQAAFFIVVPGCFYEANWAFRACCASSNLYFGGFIVCILFVFSSLFNTELATRLAEHNGFNYYSGVYSKPCCAHRRFRRNAFFFYLFVYRGVLLLSGRERQTKKRYAVGVVLCFFAVSHVYQRHCSTYFFAGSICPLSF